MALRNDNKQAHGGKRKGAGRKPSVFKELKRRIESERADDAEYAFALYASVMRDGDQPVKLRLDCAREVMDRVMGKAKEHKELTGANGGPIETKDVSDLTDGERIAELVAIFDAARTRQGGSPAGGAPQA